MIAQFCEGIVATELVLGSLYLLLCLVDKVVWTHKVRLYNASIMNSRFDMGEAPDAWLIRQRNESRLGHAQVKVWLAYARLAKWLGYDYQKAFKN